jgi:hypothetical protein
MLPIRGRQAFLFRLIAIPTAAIGAAHVVIYRRFPWEPGYAFPLAYSLTIATIILACWEVNLGLFRRLDRTLPFHLNPARRIGRQVLLGGGLTTLTFAGVFTAIARLGFGVWPSASGIVNGLFICFVIATLINGIYVGAYLLRVIYGQQQTTAVQLNARLTDPPPPIPSARTGAGLLIDTGTQTLHVQPAEIAYVYSSGGLVQLVQTDGRRVTTNYDALNPLTGQLSPTQFFQINRQFVVNLTAVRSVRDEPNRKLSLTLAPGRSPGQPTEQVIISRYRSAEFKRWLMATDPA